MQRRAGSLTDTLSLGVEPSTGGRGGRALAERSEESRGPTRKSRSHPHPRTAAFTPSFPSPNADQSQGKGPRAGGWVSEELRLEPRACSLLRALSGTFNIHTHCCAHTHAQTQTLTNTHTLTCTDLTPPRGRAAPAVSLLQAQGKRTGSNMNEIRPERLHFSSNHATSGQTAEYVTKFYFAFRVSSYASTISCGKLKL